MPSRRSADARTPRGASSSALHSPSPSIAALAMYLPLADDVGHALEHAARYLVKRAEDEGEAPQPFELTHVRPALLRLSHTS